MARRGQARGGRPGAARCWAGPRRGGLARAALAVGREVRRKAHEGKNKIFQINLNSFFIQTNFWAKSKQFQTLGQK